MNQTSPMNTATAAGAAVIVAPLVSQLAASLHISLTPDVLSALVVAIVAAAHWFGLQFSAFGAQISNYLAAKSAALLPVAPVAPTAPIVNVSVPAGVPAAQVAQAVQQAVQAAPAQQ